MFRRTLVGLGLILCAAIPTAAGGGGPVSIRATCGSVQIREIDFHTGRPSGAWKTARATTLVGTYLVRTGRGSWAHLDLPFSIKEGGKWRHVGRACLDSNSVLRIDSYADSAVRVVRGQISKADGKRIGRLPRSMGGM